MRSDWQIKNLSDIALINPKESIPLGKAAKKVPMDKLRPFCRDVSEYEIEKYSGGVKFRNGDTIMARITPCLENGKTAKINFLEDDEIAFGSTEYIVFRAIDGQCDEDFLYYLITSPIVREPAIKSMVGSSGRQRVQTDVVKSLKINVPTVNEQKAIGSLLRMIDDKIAINNKINQNLEQQAKNIYHHMFDDDSHINLSNGVLGDIATITMGQSPRGSSYNEEGYGEVFFQGRAEFGSRFPKKHFFTTEPNRMAFKNDVLMSVRAPVGDINIAHEDCCIGRGLSAIHSKDGHQSYVLYTMYSLQQTLDVFNGEGTVFGSITRNSLNSMSLYLPSMDKIDEFENIVAPMDAAILKNYDEICCLETLRDCLLPRLMSGMLDVSNIGI